MSLKSNGTEILLLALLKDKLTNSKCLLQMITVLVMNRLHSQSRVRINRHHLQAQALKTRILKSRCPGDNPRMVDLH